MKSLLLLTVVFAGAVSNIRATCQNDVDTCKATYEHGLPQTKGDTGMLCNVGNNYITCLRNLTQNAACSSLMNTINNYRRKTEEMLNRNATGCLLCASEVDTCITTYKHSASQAGNDITAVCKDGQTLALCLHTVDSKTECAAEKSRIEEQRALGEKMLNKMGCDTGHGCMEGIAGCQQTESSARNTATTPAQQCKVANTFYGCLKGQQCTGQYQAHLKQALDQLVMEAKAGNCTFTDNAGGGAGQLQHSATVVALLVVAVVAVPRSS